jgi:NMD protein affecting ribosome stability and mRNA decay
VKKLCGECGKRAVEPLAAPGRRSPFRNFPELEIPVSLAIPTCANCGAEWIDREIAGKIDEALAVRSAVVLGDIARQAIEALSATMSQRELEATLGLSAAYLSKVRHGREAPSAPLVALLSLLAARPARVGRSSACGRLGGSLPVSSARTSRGWT